MGLVVGQFGVGSGSVRGRARRPPDAPGGAALASQRMTSIRDETSVSVSSTPLPRLARRRRQMTQRRLAGDPLVRRVHPLALARAVELAGGDYARLRIEDETTVLVLNDPR